MIFCLIVFSEKETSRMKKTHILYHPEDQAQHFFGITFSHETISSSNLPQTLAPLLLQSMNRLSVSNNCMTHLGPSFLYFFLSSLFFLSCISFFFLPFYLKGRERERELSCAVHFPNAYNSKSWAEAGSHELKSSLPCGQCGLNYLSHDPQSTTVYFHKMLNQSQVRTQTQEALQNETCTSQAYLSSYMKQHLVRSASFLHLFLKPTAQPRRWGWTVMAKKRGGGTQDYSTNGKSKEKPCHEAGLQR